jgi:phage N-6-adenine-methyltransferase
MDENDLRVMFSSKTDQHATPQEFFDELDKEFNFTTDVCADDSNHKCDKYFTKEDDALKQEWTGTCFMNPPYGREIGKWMEKAYTESQKHNNTIVCLVPARTDTNWWHNYVANKSEIRFIKGRLKFGDASNSAPFPSVVVVYGPNTSVAVNKPGDTKIEQNVELNSFLKDYLVYKDKLNEVKQKIISHFINLYPSISEDDIKKFFD